MQREEKTATLQLDLFSTMGLPKVVPWMVGDKVRGSKRSGGDGTIRKLFEVEGEHRAEILWPKGRVGEYEYDTPVVQCLPLSALKRPRV